MKAIPPATIALLALCFTFSSCNEKEPEVTESEILKKPDTLVGGYEESEMDAAIAKARAKIEEFLTVLKSGNAESFSVKAPITDENGTEHFWLTDVTYTDGNFTGQVGNEPGIVKHIKLGQDWQIKTDEISDWMFTRGDLIYGAFTLEPLMHSYSEKEADAMRARLVRDNAPINIRIGAKGEATAAIPQAFFHTNEEDKTLFCMPRWNDPNGPISMRLTCLEDPRNRGLTKELIYELLKKFNPGSEIHTLGDNIYSSQEEEGKSPDGTDWHYKHYAIYVDRLLVTATIQTAKGREDEAQSKELMSAMPDIIKSLTVTQ